MEKQTLAGSLHNHRGNELDESLFIVDELIEPLKHKTLGFFDLVSPTEEA